MTEIPPSIDGASIVIANEIVAGQGEDSFAVQTNVSGGLLCVADGCGGIGSRRYADTTGHTEAYIASRLAVHCVQQWVSALPDGALPHNALAALPFARDLAQTLKQRLSDYHLTHHNTGGTRIVMRGLSRTLPTTLCTALIDARAPAQLSCLFLWAGDSRGYVLTTDGLAQCTVDHLASKADAMENLYADSRLSNMANADDEFTIDTYGLTLDKPCIVITATDGSFGYLPTPMEFELLLLTTLQTASDLNSWRTKLSNVLGKIASDDSTLAIACFGVNTFDALKQHFSARRKEFQAKYVTPVRLRRQSINHAQALWQEYRKHYELGEEARHADWRL